MLTCRACKERIERALTCPHCGERVPRIWEMPMMLLVAAAVVGGAVYYFNTFVSKPPAPGPTEAQVQAADSERQELDESALRVCALRRDHKGRDSFRIVKVVRQESGALCVHFTTRNSFGSDVGERWSVPADGAGGPQKASTCDNIGGKEATAAVAARLPSCPL